MALIIPGPFNISAKRRDGENHEINVIINNRIAFVYDNCACEKPGFLSITICMPQKRREKKVMIYSSFFLQFHQDFPYRGPETQSVT